MLRHDTDMLRFNASGMNPGEYITSLDISARKVALTGAEYIPSKAPAPAPVVLGVYGEAPSTFFTNLSQPTIN